MRIINLFPVNVTLCHYLDGVQRTLVSIIAKQHVQFPSRDSSGRSLIPGESLLRAYFMFEGNSVEMCKPTIFQHAPTLYIGSATTGEGLAINTYDGFTGMGFTDYKPGCSIPSVTIINDSKLYSRVYIGNAYVDVPASSTVKHIYASHIGDRISVLYRDTNGKYSESFATSLLTKYDNVLRIGDMLYCA